MALRITRLPIAVKPQMHANENRSPDIVESDELFRVDQLLDLRSFASSASRLPIFRSDDVCSAGEADDARPSPHAAVQPVSLDEVHWTDGFWADRLETVHKRSIPAMWEIMKGTKYKPFYQNFLIAAGDAQGRLPRRSVERRRFLQVSRGGLRRLCDRRTIRSWKQFSNSPSRAIGKAQRADGYIHTPVLIRQRHGERECSAVSGSPQFRDVQHGPSHHGRLRAPSRDGP